MLQKYDLHVFEICDNAEKLAKKLAKNWLKRYMFGGDRTAAKRVSRIVQFFASHDKHLSHNRSISVGECVEVGLKIHDLRSDRALGDAVWELWSRIEWFLGALPVAAKLFENSAGISFVRTLPQPAFVQLAGPVPVPFPVPPTEPGGPSASEAPGP